MAQLFSSNRNVTGGDFRPGGKVSMLAGFVSILPGIKDRELRTLIALACLIHGRETRCIPQVDIGAAAGLQRRPTQRALKALEKQGCIGVVRRRSKNGKRLATQYILGYWFEL